ncbi:MAG: hypothetical protein JXR86_18905 [Spirochaetales bacterium]|nr:hypothetical protein [Spirochaetales bacterium]
MKNLSLLIIVVSFLLISCVTTNEGNSSIKKDSGKDQIKKIEQDSTLQEKAVESSFLTNQEPERIPIKEYKRVIEGLPDPPAAFLYRPEELGLPLTDAKYNKTIYIYNDATLTEIETLIGHGYSQSWPKADGAVTYSFELDDGGIILFGLSPNNSGIWMVYPQRTSRFTFAGFPPLPWDTAVVDEYIQPGIALTDLAKKLRDETFSNYDNFRIDISDNQTIDAFKTGLPQLAELEQIRLIEGSRLLIAFTFISSEIDGKNLFITVSGNGNQYSENFRLRIPRGGYFREIPWTLLPDKEYQIDIFIDMNGNNRKDPEDEIYSERTVTGSALNDGITLEKL